MYSVKYRLSILHCLCSDVVMKYLRGGELIKKKRQLYAIVLQSPEPDTRSGFNSGGYLVVDDVTVAVGCVKEHSHGMAGKQSMEGHLTV